MRGPAPDREESLPRLSRARPGAAAFTLMELLVAMAIISFLAGILLTGVMVARSRGGVARTKSLITVLDLAVRKYEIETGDYPPGAGGIASAESLYAHLTSPKWSGQYEFGEKEAADTDGDGRLEVVDHWGRPVSYCHHRSYSRPGPPNAASFRLVSAGPDGEEGTRDDITNFR
jgi:prepilin-type N-terminal cleavage/methylation domain-containing protein